MAVDVYQPKKKENDSLGKTLSVLQIASTASNLASTSAKSPAQAEVDSPDASEPSQVSGTNLKQKEPGNQTAAMNRRYNKGGYTA